MLTHPGWLLRVGLYLEFLTCLGVAEAVRPEVDLLHPEEREAFETSPRLVEIRQRIDGTAWRKVWELREIAFSKPGSPAPTGVRNLLRKKNATLAFLHAHHEDLKHAIDLAGANLHNAQDSPWVPWNGSSSRAEAAPPSSSSRTEPWRSSCAPAAEPEIRGGVLRRLRRAVFGGPC